MDSVCVCFPMGVGEVAEQYYGGALVGVGDDACPGKACLSKCAGRGFCSHKFRGVQFPAKSGAVAGGTGGTAPIGGIHKGVGAGQLQDSCRGDADAFAGHAVIEHHLDELQQVGNAAEHACAAYRK